MEKQNANDYIFTGIEDVTLNLDITTEIRFSRKDHPEGKMVPVSVNGKEEFILIPLDVKDGSKLKFEGRGKNHSRSGKNGDLYVLVHIEEKGLPWKKMLLPIIGVVAIACLLIMLLMNKSTEQVQPTSPSTKPAQQVQVTPLPTKPEQTVSVCVHDWIPADCKTPKTCSKCGESIGDTSGHVWNDANYNAPQTCTVCGETEGEKKTPTLSVGLRDIVSSSSASSVYSGDNLGRHAPEKLYDGKLDTNWTEDSSGNGVGEFVVFDFDDTYAVNKLRIYIGSHYNEGVYKQNCRPKAITITFSDGSTEFVRLEDSYDEQVITFKQFYYTDSIKLTIEEVYTGTKYLDAVIAELDFVAYEP